MQSSLKGSVVCLVKKEHLEVTSSGMYSLCRSNLVITWNLRDALSLVMSVVDMRSTERIVVWARMELHKQHQ